MRSSTRTLLFTAVAPVLGAVSFLAPATACADTWDNSNGNAGWSTATNWADDTEPQAGDDVVFPLGQPGGAGMIVIGSGELAKSLTFNDSYLLNGDTLTLAAGGEVTVAAGKSATINANLAGGNVGSNGLTKLGTGTLTLSSHTFTGQVEITQGTLSVAANHALGNPNNPVLLNGGTLLTGTFTTSRPIMVGGGNGAIEVALNQTLTIDSPLTGVGTLTLHPTSNAPMGDRTIVLNAASARTGLTSIEQGVVRLNHGTALGTGTINLKLNASLDLNNVTVDQPMTLTSAGNLRSRGTGVGGSNATYAGTITIGPSNHIALLSTWFSNDTLTIGNAANDLTGGTSQARLIVSGNGRVRLPFANSYAGKWDLSSGTLSIGHPDALGTGTTPLNMTGNSGILELANGVTFGRDIAMANSTNLTANGSGTFTGTITLAAGAAVQVGGNSATKITLGNGPNDLTGGGANTVMRKTGPGVVELTQRSNLQAGVAVWGGTLVVKPGAQLAGGNGAPGASAIASLEIIGAGSKLDLTSNAVVVRNGTLGTKSGGTYTGLSGLIQSGHNFGAWDGAGIITSIGDAASGLTSIGIATGAQTGYTTFAGVSVNPSDVIVMYTYAGDANLDGLISGDDYAAIDGNAAVPGASGWYNGDFNYDGIISGDDYASIDSNIVAQGAPFPTSPGFAGVTPVPEPAALTGAIAAAAGLVGRRSRRR